MARLVECIPNFSEGRNPVVIDQIVNEITKVSGIRLTDHQMNADHNRAVITFVGTPEACKEAAFNACKKAKELIDLTKHQGEHPRVGATDVIPFVPISDVTMEECVQTARSLAKEIAEKLEIPTFLYEESATSSVRRDLAFLRKGEFEGLNEAIAKDPANRAPDFGPSKLHPTAGGTVVGAREYLIAYNVDLGTNNLDIAKAIAKTIRFKGGGFKNVKALGFAIKERDIVQVSINLTNFKESSIFRAFEFVKREAERYGVPVIGSEIVGVVPLQAIVDTADWYLRLENFSANQVLEKKVWGETADGGDILPRAFMSKLASKSPAPGGGSAAALSGALGAALICMVCELTIGKEKYKDVESEMIKIKDKASEAKDKFLKLVLEDETAFNKVMASYGLPKDTEEEKTERAKQIQIALKGATEIPLEVIRTAKEALLLSKPCAEKGNVNSVSDAGVSAIELQACAKGALYNVLINLGGIKDEKFKNKVQKEIDELMKEIVDLTVKVEETTKKKIEG